MAQITLKQIEALVQVADLGSFRRAAERLNTTQPNISARISGLETQLGRKLMDRDAGSVRLTPVGRALVARARTVLRAVDGMMQAAGDDNLFEGVLRLGATEMVVAAWLGRFLDAFRERFPGIDVALTIDLSANLSAALARRELDVALQNGPFARQTTGNYDLGRFRMIWLAAPKLGLSGRRVTAGEIAQRPILTHAKGTQPYEQLNEHFLSVSDSPVRFVSSTNISACLSMAQDGQGVACLPAVMAEEPLRAGLLDELDYVWVPESLEFWARYDAETAPSYVVQAAQIASATARALDK
ncbi:LysR family transcriptional regulator [Aliishimia ponticola]|uniref:LysR family transcriptional regulator n=1 Tax=Aliishimia ponticola TaxID=2499833 RepID=A0A4S4NDW3_9RHOB|nr:LysR family transcriptional regulator [Aliishimia ponticola]THH36935.1 LysR family transcriptional regulator [Aliishimia ponticola]